MLLKKLTLSNFRQFKNKETIHFSRDKEANITLILGDNTSGKTTVLQSFMWCLYGESKLTFKSKKQLYNEENALEMKNGETREIEVTLELSHLEKEYIIKRTQQCEKQNDKVYLVGVSDINIYYKTENYEMKPVKSIDIYSTIEKILPSDLSEYFFYDTERFGNITDKKDVTNAVKGLLGLTILENTIAHLGRRTRSNTVINNIYGDLNEEGNKKVEEINEELVHLDVEISRKRKSIEAVKKELIFYNDEKTKKEEQLRLLKPTMELQKSIDEEKKKIEGYKEEIENQSRVFLNSFRRGTLEFFITPLLERTSKIIEKTDIKEDFIKGMHADSIYDIIDRGHCVCGTKVTDNSEEYASLQKALKVIPPHSIGVLIDKYETLAKNSIQDRPYLKNEIDNIHNIITQLQLNVSKSDNKVTELQKQIKEVDNAKTLQVQLDDIEQKIMALHHREGKYQSQLDSLKEDYDKKNTEIKNYLNISNKNTEIKNILAYAEEVLRLFENDYNDKNSEIKRDLEEKVNYYFQEIYHGNRIVKIDENFKVTLYNTDNKGITTDESAGLETVKNFAFIAGLVDLAKQKLEEGKERDYRLLEEEYPLVLDAPFSNVDENHVINISKILPTVTGQLILIVMEKDWNYASEQLDVKVGKTYKLNKISELHTTIE